MCFNFYNTVQQEQTKALIFFLGEREIERGRRGANERERERGGDADDREREELGLGFLFRFVWGWVGYPHKQKFYNCNLTCPARVGKNSTQFYNFNPKYTACLSGFCPLLITLRG